MDFHFKKRMAAPYKVNFVKDAEVAPTRKMPAQGGLTGKMIAPVQQQRKPFDNIQYLAQLADEICAAIRKSGSPKQKSRAAVPIEDKIKFANPQVNNFVGIRVPPKNFLPRDGNLKAKPQFNRPALGQDHSNHFLHRINPPPQRDSNRRATPVTTSFRARTIRHRSISNKPDEKMIQAATRIQAAYRGAKARGKENKFGLYEIKNRAKQVVGYVRYKDDNSVKSKAGKDASHTGRKYTEAILAIPPGVKRGESGTFKTVVGKHNETHMAWYGGTIALALKNPEQYVDLKPEILQAIKHLRYIVRQYRISDKYLISKAMNDDLFNEINNGESYGIDAFKQVLMNLKTLHEQNIVHRDIKPENLFIKKTRRPKNLFFRMPANLLSKKTRMPEKLCYRNFRDINSIKLFDWKNEVYLGDLDMMGKMGEFTGFDGTREYTPGFILNMATGKDETPQNTYGKICDNYAMVLSLMKAGNIDLSKFENITQWINQNVKQEYRSSILMLLFEPQEYSQNSDSSLHLYDMFEFDKPLRLKCNRSLRPSIYRPS